MTEKDDGGPDLLGFANAMAEEWAESGGMDLDGGALQDMLVSFGLLKFRAAKPSEVADLEWWGHEFYDDNSPGKEFVGEKTPGLIAMLKARKGE